MKLLLTVALLSILVSGLTFAQSGAPSCGAPKNAAEQRPQVITITRSGSLPSSTGPAENFRSSVRIDLPFQAKYPSHVSGAASPSIRVHGQPGTLIRWVRF